MNPNTNNCAIDSETIREFDEFMKICEDKLPKTLKYYAIKLAECKNITEIHKVLDEFLASNLSDSNDCILSSEDHIYYLYITMAMHHMAEYKVVKMRFENNISNEGK